MVSSIRKQFVLFLMLTTIETSRTQLTINVSSGEPDAVSYRQTITGNSTSETVSISLVTPAGNGVHQLTDFKSRLVITSVTVPGELELGQPSYQVLCFVTPITADVIIPAEAITKLRQKHRGAVRVAEESRGRVVQDNSISLVVSRSHSLSPHIAPLCQEARQTTFAPEQLLQQYKDGVIGSRKGSRKAATFLNVNEKYSGQSRCAQLSHDNNDPCLCFLDTCVHWYPCSLKYCSNGDGGEHRCGIRTCSQCEERRFTARSKLHCSWDQL